MMIWRKLEKQLMMSLLKEKNKVKGDVVVMGLGVSADIVQSTNIDNTYFAIN